jgi:hypothetical protein
VTTALQIIERSLRTIGVLAAGETATADQAKDALVCLNDVLEGLSNESLAIYVDALDQLTMDGSTSYTYGDGGDLDSVRPVSVTNVYYRDTNNIDYPVEMITSDQYDSIYSKTLSTGIPTVVYFNPAYPLSEIYPWPLSSAGTLFISAKKPLLNLSTYNTVLVLPVGYERLLRYALAVELMPEYGIQNAQVLGMMMEAKASIKRTNSRSSVLTVNLPFGGAMGYASGRRILSDGI